LGAGTPRWQSPTHFCSADSPGSPVDTEARDSLLVAAWENLGLLEEIEDAVRSHA
jgi:hypothetical protein